MGREGQRIAVGFGEATDEREGGVESDDVVGVSVH